MVAKTKLVTLTADERLLDTARRYYLTYGATRLDLFQKLVAAGHTVTELEQSWDEELAAECHIGGRARPRHPRGELFS